MSIAFSLIYTLILFYCIHKQIAKEVAENGLRPKIAEVEEQLEGVIELIAKSWDQEPEIRPIFAEITSVLRIVDKRLRDIQF